MRSTLRAFLFLGLVSCGSSENSTLTCDGPYAGTYSGSTPVGTSLILGADCAYQYVGTDGCQSQGTYGAALGTSGTVAVSITSATVGACLPAGGYVCEYLIVEGAAVGLGIDCGAGAQGFSKN